MSRTSDRACCTPVQTFAVIFVDSTPIQGLTRMCAVLMQVVDPSELIEKWGQLRLHGTYYITKQILPALQRLFGLVGADLRAWYVEMPKVYRPPPSKRPSAAASRPPPSARWGDFGHVPGQVSNGPSGGDGRPRSGPPGKEEDDAAEGAEWALIGAANAADLIQGGVRGKSSKRGAGGTIDQYYLSRHCAVCSQLTRAAETVCKECAAKPQVVGMALTGRASKLEREYSHLVAVRGPSLEPQ
jgi:DNA polymerase zeta